MIWFKVAAPKWVRWVLEREYIYNHLNGLCQYQSETQITLTPDGWQTEPS